MQGRLRRFRGPCSDHHAGRRARRQPRGHDRAPAQPAAGQASSSVPSVDRRGAAQPGRYLSDSAHHGQVRGQVAQLNYRIDMDTLHREPAQTLQPNEIGRVKFTTSQPLFFDPYQINRATGGFILIDPYTNNTVAAGIIRPRRRSWKRSSAGRPERPRSTNVTWESAAMIRGPREERNGHRPRCCGSPVCRARERAGWRACWSAGFLGMQTFYLDGDNVQHGSTVIWASPRPTAKKTSAAWPKSQTGLRPWRYHHLYLHLTLERNRTFARSLLPGGRFIGISPSAIRSL